MHPAAAQHQTQRHPHEKCDRQPSATRRRHHDRRTDRHEREATVDHRVLVVRLTERGREPFSGNHVANTMQDKEKPEHSRGPLCERPPPPAGGTRPRRGDLPFHGRVGRRGRRTPEGIGQQHEIRLHRTRSGGAGENGGDVVVEALGRRDLLGIERRLGIGWIVRRHRGITSLSLATPR
ncbi:MULTISPECIES: hypothetical protein [Gordonia]|uniref:Uncharacterized protein n=1 Tax=Gordonia amicalis TaxID=89053 RepID=A0AAE4R487_9ACTN|nr:MULTISPECIES: hypothetical protein [Gordonia]MDV6312789.1 hypothetical protein [Gordonia amicalis]UPW15882.1 hypothetical protein M0655_10365 [Gordonia amicalis]